MPTTISDIPAEVFANICDNISDVADILALRLTNRDLCGKSQFTFERRWFHTLKVMLHPISLDMLAAIADHPEYSTHVKRLVIGSEVVSGVPADNRDRLAHESGLNTQQQRRNYGRLVRQEERMTKQRWIEVLQTAIPRFRNLERLDLETSCFSSNQFNLWGRSTPKCCGAKRVQALTGVNDLDQRRHDTTSILRIYNTPDVFETLCHAILYMDPQNVNIGVGGDYSYLQYSLPEEIASEFDRVHFRIDNEPMQTHRYAPVDSTYRWCRELTLEFSYPDMVSVQSFPSVGGFTSLSRLTLGGGLFPVQRLVKLLNANQATMTHIRIYGYCRVLSEDDTGWLLALQEMLGMPCLVELELADLMEGMGDEETERPVCLPTTFTNGLPVHWKGKEEIVVRLEEVIDSYDFILLTAPYPWPNS